MTNNTDPSKEIEIPQKFIEWAEDTSEEPPSDFPGKYYSWFIAAQIRMAEAAYRYLSGSPSPSGWIEIGPGCQMPEYTERHKWFNDETGQREEYGEPAFQIVLAYNEELGIFKAKYEKHGRWSEISSCSINGTVKPTHWMPLPSPPTTSGDK